jgi:SOS-response transcriptional repressor LexA
VSLLTGRQLEIFTFIYEHARDNGFQPSYREIGERFGIRSPNGMKEHLRLIRRKGYLALPKSFHQARAVVFLKRPDGTAFHGFSEKQESISHATNTAAGILN